MFRSQNGTSLMAYKAILCHIWYIVHLSPQNLLKMHCISVKGARFIMIVPLVALCPV